MGVKRDEVDQALQRIALAAFMYYPLLAVDDPDYSVETEAEWCLTPLGTLSVEQRQQVRQTVMAAIINPTGNREHTFQVLDALVPDDGE